MFSLSRFTGLHRSSKRIQSTTPTAQGPRLFATKRLREFRVTLKDGRETLVRRTREEDATQLTRFFDETPLSRQYAFLRPQHVHHSVVQALQDAQDTRSDTFIAVMDERVVALTQLQPVTRALEHPVNKGFLAGQGLVSWQVCISRMVVTPCERRKGLAHALKAAQVVAAGDAGYAGVVSEAYNPAIQAVVKRAGGVLGAGEGAWTLVWVPDGCADKP